MRSSGPSLQLGKFWLIFAQATTVCLALLFIVETLRPEWLPRGLPAQRTTASVSGLSGVTQASPLLAPAGHPVATASYSEAAQRAMPAVVNINTSKAERAKNPLANDPLLRRFFGGRRNPGDRQSTLGSGVIVNAEGYILTNNHVIDAGGEIDVALADGRKATATVVGTDPETDLAVIKIALPNLPVITFGRVEDARVGDVVLAIGNPFAVGQTVTMGIVSALGRNHLDISTFENFIQTDAAINPGNSGGALVDVRGNLLGINAAIYSRSGGSLGIGFAVPVSTARQVLESIIANGQVVRGYIGVEPQDITPEMAETLKLPRAQGVVISGIYRGGPADEAGVKPGDILIGVGSQGVTDTTTMLNAIAQLKPGTNAELKLVRGKRDKHAELNLAVKVGKRPKPEPEPEE